MKRLAGIFIILTGFFFIYKHSENLQSHLRSLGKHLISGSWKITDDKQQLYKYLKKYYETKDGEYMVHMLIGSGYDYVLTEANAEDTFHLLGEMVPLEEGLLNRSLLNLADEYGEFLAESTKELIPSATKSDIDLLKSFFNNKDHTRLSDSALKKVKEIYKLLPNQSLLVNGITEYNKAKAFKSRLRTLKTFTRPYYNRDVWNKRSLYIDGFGDIEVDTTLRGKGTIHAISDPNNIIPAEIRTTSRLHKVIFERNWLSNSLIESKFKEKGERTSRFFKKGGGLRLIPEEIWVKGNDRVIVTLDNPDDRKTLLENNDKEYVIKGNNLGEHVEWNIILLGKGKKENELVGLQLPYYSQLIALISRDRLIP